jgi:hypothetical protein
MILNITAKTRCQFLNVYFKINYPEKRSEFGAL